MEHLTEKELRNTPLKEVFSRSKPWTYSIVLSIASVASFFLPWFETTSRASYGSQSFSQSLQASPAAALIVYIQWFALSILSAFLAYRRSRFSFLPALLNFYPLFAFGGLLGKHNSFGYDYSAYGASVSASTHLAYGYWIFAATTILFFLATISELFKSRKNAIEQKSASSVKEGFIQPKNIAQNKRSLEELKQAKELLDAGAITQEEFEQIKQQALGTKPVVAVKPQQTEAKQEDSQLPTTKAIQEAQPIAQKTIESKRTVAQPRKQNKNLKWIIGGGVVILIIAAASIFIFKSSNNNDAQDLVGETDVTFSIKEGDQEEVETKLVDSNNATIISGNEEALADSYFKGFLSTSTGERYKKIKVQIPNNDEAGTTSEIEIISPVEGLYVSNKEGKTWSIKISYDGEKIYSSHWVDAEQAVNEEAYITSKGYFAFGGEEYEYDRYGETVDDVKNLTLVGRYSGEIFSWSKDQSINE